MCVSIWKLFLQTASHSDISLLRVLEVVLEGRRPGSCQSREAQYFCPIFWASVCTPPALSPRVHCNWRWLMPAAPCAARSAGLQWFTSICSLELFQDSVLCYLLFGALQALTLISLSQVALISLVLCTRVLQHLPRSTGRICAGISGGASFRVVSGEISISSSTNQALKILAGLHETPYPWSSDSSCWPVRNIY